MLEFKTTMGGDTFRFQFLAAEYTGATTNNLKCLEPLVSAKSASDFAHEVQIASGGSVGTKNVVYWGTTVDLGTTYYIRIEYGGNVSLFGVANAERYFYRFYDGSGNNLLTGTGDAFFADYVADPTKLANLGYTWIPIFYVSGIFSDDYAVAIGGELAPAYQMGTPTLSSRQYVFLKKPNGQYIKLSELNNGLEPVTKFPGDTSDTGGGDGEYDISDIPILLPILPQYSATDTKFVSIYLPTEAQIKSLASYVWGTKDFWTAVYKDMVANPMDLILGLGVIPNVGTVTGEKSVKVGIFDTGVAMNYTEKQFFDFDCGKVTIGKYYGNAIDQSPNTRFSIFLPFIGVRQLNTDEIIGREVGVHYRIDVVSGQCLALIQIDGSVRYQFAGSCLSQIPFSGSSYNGLINAGVNMAIQTGTAIATGGATGAVAVASGANFLSSMKPDIHRVGGIGGSAGVLGVLTPYIIRETPKQSLANDYNKFVGYPSNITAKLSELTGFTQIEKIRISGIIATDVELTEIEQILKQGVIL